MRKWALCAAAMLATILPGAAVAADKDPCGPNLICASNPKSIADAMMAAGYKAQLGTDSGGDPQIKSAASGYNFTVYFYGCEKGAACSSIQFYIGFKDDGKNTLDLVNRWNVSKRFAQMSLDKDKGLNVSYDLGTIGGLNQKNFADAVDWWATMLSELNGFFKEN